MAEGVGILVPRRSRLPAVDRERLLPRPPRPESQAVGFPSVGFDPQSFTT